MTRQHYRRMPDMVKIDDDNFKVIVKGLRANMDMSQKEFADFLGYSQQNVNQWENGTRQTTITSFIDMIEACGFELVIRRKE